MLWIHCLVEDRSHHRDMENCDTMTIILVTLACCLYSFFIYYRLYFSKPIIDMINSYLPGFALYNVKLPPLLVCVPTDELFKNMLALATGFVSAWFKTLPVMVNWAKQPKGSSNKRKGKIFNICGFNRGKSVYIGFFIKCVRSIIKCFNFIW